MLQIIFGDDEHTAADGPYSRLMKTRKWLYLSSAAAIAMASGLYDEASVKEILKVVELPIWTLAPALCVGLGYLTAQYLLLLRQLVSIYDLVLADRLQTRRVDDLNAARERIKDADAELHAALKASAEHDARLSRLTDELRTLKQQNDGADAAARQGAGMGDRDDVMSASQVFTNAMRIAELEKALAAEQGSNRTALVDSARSAAVQAHEAYQQIYMSNPGNRSGYRASEVAIDALRLVPPLAASGYALWRLVPVALPASL